MNRLIITGIVLLLLSMSAFPQTRKARREIALKDVVFQNEFSLGARIMTNGWAVFGERAKILSIYKTRVLQFEFLEFRDFRQTKQQPVDYYNISSLLETNRDYYFGKQNNFYALHAGFGYRKRIADKADKNGVRLSLLYLAGVSLGIQKPYYLEYIDSTYVRTNGDFTETVFIIVNDRYRESNADKFLDASRITSASGFKYGLSEIVPVPGIYGKIALNFDWATHDQFVKALETGINFDLYYKRIPIMVTDDNKAYFIGLYLSFQFGKRW